MEKIIASEITPAGIDGEILRYLEEHQVRLSLTDAVVYFGFPVFKDYEDNSIKSKFCILSPSLGLVLLTTTDSEEVELADDSLMHIPLIPDTHSVFNRTPFPLAFL